MGHGHATNFDFWRGKKQPFFTPAKRTEEYITHLKKYSFDAHLQQIVTFRAINTSVLGRQAQLDAIGFRFPRDINLDVIKKSYKNWELWSN